MDDRRTGRELSDISGTTTLDEREDGIWMDGWCLDLRLCYCLSPDVR